jgi:hypothetical protein
MPSAFKGYPYPMKLAIKTTVLILLASLLSGCSGGSEQAKCELIQRAVSEQSAEINSLTESALSMVNPELKTLNIIMERLEKLRRSKFNNIISAENCFIPSEITEASDWISRNLE